MTHKRINCNSPNDPLEDVTTNEEINDKSEENESPDKRVIDHYNKDRVKSDWNIALLFLILALFSSSIYLFIVRLQSKTPIPPNRPKVWINQGKYSNSYVRHVTETFQKLGYERVNGSAGEDWDILWSYEGPFGSKGVTVKKHQRVNYVPGSSLLTHKATFSTGSKIKGIPKSFSLPRQKQKFLDYVKENPQKLWIMKGNNHRGIKLVKPEKIDFKKNGSFVQEFISKPYLIDGRRFDIGVFAVMTSIYPLRVYTLDNDALIRFCPNPYYPFNASDLDSYVVNFYKPIWEMPSLQESYTENRLNQKQTFNEYLIKDGKDPEKLWKSINEIIADVYFEKADAMRKETLKPKYPSPRNFFQLVRFDLIVDEDLNIYLLEINMSPSLSSNYLKGNRIIYEQVVFNALSVSGVVNTLNAKNWLNRKESLWSPLVSDRDLAVFPELCSSEDCKMSCKNEECRHCAHCLTIPMRTTLKDAYLEHHSRWNMRRLIPTMSNQDSVNTSADAIQLKWFEGKCKLDVSWC